MTNAAINSCLVVIGSLVLFIARDASVDTALLRSALMHAIERAMNSTGESLLLPGIIRLTLLSGDPSNTNDDKPSGLERLWMVWAPLIVLCCIIVLLCVYMRRVHFDQVELDDTHRQDFDLWGAGRQRSWMEDEISRTSTLQGAPFVSQSMNYSPASSIVVDSGHKPMADSSSITSSEDESSSDGFEDEFESC